MIRKQWLREVLKIDRVQPIKHKEEGD